ncbi:hypothetical protein QW131_31960 [Roseibium salinum]|nr:hypothetical protein [Roseibium salinum]
MNVYGAIDAGADGVLDALASGYVRLVEFQEDMNIGRVESRYNNVLLGAINGDILDAFEDEEADVLGAFVQLNALQGQIGNAGESDGAWRSVDVNSTLNGTGGLTAGALGDIFLIETTGDMNVVEIVSDAGNVRLEAYDGGILDTFDEDEFETDVIGRSIDLIAVEGAIGVSGNDLEIDSAKEPDGRLFASSGGDIYLLETSDSLHLLRAASSGGDVRLRTFDTAFAPAMEGQFPYLEKHRREPHFSSKNGTTLIGDAYDRAVVSAAGAVTLEIGDDVTMRSNSLIEAGSSVVIRGDFFRIGENIRDADSDYGTRMWLTGEIRPIGDYQGYSARIYGGGDADSFTLTDLFPGRLHSCLRRRKRGRLPCDRSPLDE